MGDGATQPRSVARPVAATLAYAPSPALTVEIIEKAIQDAGGQVTARRTDPARPDATLLEATLEADQFRAFHAWLERQGLAEPLAPTSDLRRWAYADEAASATAGRALSIRARFNLKLTILPPAR